MNDDTQVCIENQKRRLLTNGLKLMGGGALLFASGQERWARPIISSMVLPAHAQTSSGAVCTGFDVEPVNQAIIVTVNTTEIAGPIAIAWDGVATSFSEQQSAVISQCTDLNNVLQDLNQDIEFSGTINGATSQIAGNLTIRQFCGTELVCEQLTNFVVTQDTIDPGSNLGPYSGTLTGTLRCCRDFLP